MKPAWDPTRRLEKVLESRNKDILNQIDILQKLSRNVINSLEQFWSQISANENKLMKVTKICFRTSKIAFITVDILQICKLQ